MLLIMCMTQKFYIVKINVYNTLLNIHRKFEITVICNNHNNDHMIIIHLLTRHKKSFIVNVEDSAS